GGCRPQPRSVARYAGRSIASSTTASAASPRSWAASSRRVSRAMSLAASCSTSSSPQCCTSTAPGSAATTRRRCSRPRSLCALGCRCGRPSGESVPRRRRCSSTAPLASRTCATRSSPKRVPRAVCVWRSSTTSRRPARRSPPRRAPSATGARARCACMWWRSTNRTFGHTARVTVSASRWVMRGLLLFALAFANLHDIWSPDVLPNALLPFTLLREGNVDYDEFVFRPGDRETELQTSRNALDMRLDSEAYFFRACGKSTATAPPRVPRSKGGPPAPGPKDHVCSVFPPGMGLLALPFFLPFVLSGFDALDLGLLIRVGHVAAAFYETIAALLLWAVLRRIASERQALALVLLYFLGTSVRTVSSQALWHHAGVHLAIAIALWLVIVDRAGLRREALRHAGARGPVRPALLAVAGALHLRAVGRARDRWDAHRALCEHDAREHLAAPGGPCLRMGRICDRICDVCRVV